MTSPMRQLRTLLHLQEGDIQRTEAERLMAIGQADVDAVLAVLAKSR